MIDEHIGDERDIFVRVEFEGERELGVWQEDEEEAQGKAAHHKEIRAIN